MAAQKYNKLSVFAIKNFGMVFATQPITVFNMRKQGFRVC